MFVSFSKCPDGAPIAAHHAPPECIDGIVERIAQVYGAAEAERRSRLPLVYDPGGSVRTTWKRQKIRIRPRGGRSSYTLTCLDAHIGALLAELRHSDPVRRIYGGLPTVTVYGRYAILVLPEADVGQVIRKLAAIEEGK